MHYEFNGIGTGLHNLARLSNAKSRSISAENFKGEKGKGGMSTDGELASNARELGPGWKISPCVRFKPNETITLAEIEGPGCIQHIWVPPEKAFYRYFILRIYWDGEAEPSVCCPIGDFFCQGWNERQAFQSLAICVNPKSGFNCYFQMPFRKSCRITLENLTDKTPLFFWQIDYILTDVPEDMAYFHAMWRRTNPLPYMQDYTIVDGIKGKGQYVGTYLAYESKTAGWWGEGEIKFFMDGDTKYPTICGTGTEDYFCGAWCFGNETDDGYDTFAGPYTGFFQVILPDRYLRSSTRFGMYRWHITDPVRFDSDLKITLQAIGWRSEGRYLPLQDDLASVAYWYQTEPHNPFKQDLSKNNLEVIVP